MKKIRITDGAGLISSHIVWWFVKKHPEHGISNLDKTLYQEPTGKDLAIMDFTKYPKRNKSQGEIVWDGDKLYGTPRKMINVSKLNSKGWKYSIALEGEIKDTYRWFLKHINNYRRVKIENF